MYPMKIKEKFRKLKYSNVVLLFKNAKHRTNLRLHQRATKKIMQILSNGLHQARQTSRKRRGKWMLVHRQLWGLEGHVPCLTGYGPVLNGHILTTNLVEVSVSGENPCDNEVSKVKPGP